MFLLQLSIISFLQIFIVIILIISFSFFKKSTHYLKLIPTLYLILFINSFLLLIFLHYHIRPFYWNWLGKSLETLWPLFVVFVFKWMSPKEVGYLWTKAKSGWLLAGGISLIIVFLSLVMDLLLNDSGSKLPMPETLLFQATIPGLAEEQVYRGIMLALCNRYFPRQWKFYTAPFGLGLITVTLLFAANHVVTYSPKTHKIIYSFDALLPILFIGFFLGWIREKTGSIWPAVFAHNMINTLYIAGRWLLISV
ncbi:MAG: hypothetical protein S4CHLAM123_08270 [Chlamydiales bacterium]|nr:hypothetical protein [Chlamydiales bacterium]